MGTMSIAVDGEPSFEWDGDDEEIKNILETFPQAAKDVGLTPRKFADACLLHLKGGLSSPSPPGQEMQMMGVIWRILETESPNAEHPGKIAVYAATTDLDIDLQSSDDGFNVEMHARSRFDS
jgi:hypothetical protein